MKKLKSYILLFCIGHTSVCTAVTLPSSSFYGANELYTENNGEIEYVVGTKIRGINYILSAVNSSWGDECKADSFGDEGACQDCCGEYLDKSAGGSGDIILYNTCMDICGGNPLPLGSALWLMPFILIYAGIKVRKRRVELKEKF